MRAFITGGTGHVGTFLTEALLQRGYQVTLFDCVRPRQFLDENDEQVHFIQGDLGNAMDVFYAVIESCPTDIFHLGAVIGTSCDKNPLRSLNINFMSTAILLDAAYHLGISRFFMLSSLAVFGLDAGDPATDDAPKNPPNIYGQTKLSSEHLLCWYAKQHGIDARALRFPRTFGSHRVNGFTAVYSAMLDAIAEGNPFVVPDPDATGSWLYIRNAVQAILDFHFAPEPGRRVYNIGAPMLTARQFAEYAVSIHPGSQLTYLPTDTRQETPYPRGLDDTCARNDWGWNPAYDLEGAIRDHICMKNLSDSV